MILNGGGGSKKQSALLREIISKCDGDFHCLNCLQLFRTKNKVDLTKKYVKIKIFVVL